MPMETEKKMRCLRGGDYNTNDRGEVSRQGKGGERVSSRKRKHDSVTSGARPALVQKKKKNLRPGGKEGENRETQSAPRGMNPVERGKT